jgi:hypothetical protein
MSRNFFVKHDCWFFHFAEFHFNGGFVTARLWSKSAVFCNTSITCFAVTALFVVVKSFLSLFTFSVFSLSSCHDRRIILTKNFFFVNLSNFTDTVFLHSSSWIWKGLSFSLSLILKSFPFFLFLLNIFHKGFNIFKWIEIKFIVIFTFWTVHESMFLASQVLSNSF